jgi:hypothetical protein
MLIHLPSIDRVILKMIAAKEDQQFNVVSEP